MKKNFEGIISWFHSSRFQLCRCFGFNCVNKKMKKKDFDVVSFAHFMENSNFDQKDLWIESESTQ